MDAFGAIIVIRRSPFCWLMTFSNQVPVLLSWAMVLCSRSCCESVRGARNGAAVVVVPSTAMVVRNLANVLVNMVRMENVNSRCAAALGWGILSSGREPSSTSLYITYCLFCSGNCAASTATNYLVYRNLEHIHSFIHSFGDAISALSDYQAAVLMNRRMEGLQDLTCLGKSEVCFAYKKGLSARASRVF